MARLFDLPQTRGQFQAMGIISGVEKDKFYTEKETKTGKDFRAVNFGCKFDKDATMYINLTGMPKDKVYFSKRENGKSTTKDVPFAQRNKFHEDGFKLIGVNLGLEKITDENGKLVNNKKTMVEYDACEYISNKLRDDSSVFIKGNLDFSSYIDNNGDTRRSIKYVPNQISLCKSDIDFDDFDYVDKKPVHDFEQTIVFTGIEKEMDDGKDTGRFVVGCYIVTWSDVVATEFIITDPKLAGLFKKNLKKYYAITVNGKIEVSHSIETVDEDDCWGESSAMSYVSNPTKIELVITGARPSTIDKTTYTEENISDAIKKIRNSKTAENNFNGGSKSNKTEESDDDWGDSDDWVTLDDSKVPF